MRDKYDFIGTALVFAFIFWVFDGSRVPSNGTDTIYAKACDLDSYGRGLYDENLRDFDKCEGYEYRSMGFWISADAQKVLYGYDPKFYSPKDCFVVDRDNWSCLGGEISKLHGQYGPYSEDGEIDISGLWSVKKTNALVYWYHHLKSYIE